MKPHLVFVFLLMFHFTKGHIRNVSLCDVIISVDNHVLFVSPSKLFFFFTSFAEVQEIMNLSMTVVLDLQCFFLCVAISLEVLLLAQKKSQQGN